MADRLQKVLVQLQEVALDALDAAHEDHKTPLLNERALARDGDALLADEGAWTIFSGDINDFKNLNAEVGYNNADIVLHAVGVALQDICRETGGSGYRRGGDEFVLIVPRDKAAEVSAAIVRRLCPRPVPLDPPVEAYVSFGYADLDKSISFHDTLERADDACKAAKWQEDGSPVAWSEDVATGFHARLRCPTCRSQFSISVPPERAARTDMACMICGDPLG